MHRSSSRRRPGKCDSPEPPATPPPLRERVFGRGRGIPCQPLTLDVSPSAPCGRGRLTSRKNQSSEKLALSERPKRAAALQFLRNIQDDQSDASSDDEDYAPPVACSSDSSSDSGGEVDSDENDGESSQDEECK